MKIKLFVFIAAMLVSQAFAFIGFGVHYAPAFNTKMSASDWSKVSPAEALTEIYYQHDGLKDNIMHGLGFKLWLDSIAIVDFEATVNLQYGSYDARLLTKTDDPLEPGKVHENLTPLEIELAGTPFGKATPKYVAMTADFSITYPFLTNIITFIRPHIGVGATLFMNTFIMDSDFISNLLEDEEFKGLLAGDASSLAGDLAAGLTPEEIANRKAEKVKQMVQDQAKEKSLNISVGGHVLLGATIKLPVLPLAIYINGKYYFGGIFPEEISTDSYGYFAAEGGIGLSF